MRGRQIGLRTWVGATSIVLMATMGACGQGETKRAVNATSVAGKAGFTPSVITVDKGDKIDVSVGNTTDKPHGFSIQGYGVRKEIVPGQTVHAIFRADKPGTYRISCQLHPAHELATLVVQ